MYEQVADLDGRRQQATGIETQIQDQAAGPIRLQFNERLAIAEAINDIRAAGVDILTLGQYLRPTPNHLPIERWVTPEEFDHYRVWALEKGFLECVSGPLVRSSYRAERVLERNNAGLQKSG